MVSAIQVRTWNISFTPKEEPLAIAYCGSWILLQQVTFNCWNCIIWAWSSQHRCQIGNLRRIDCAVIESLTRFANLSPLGILCWTWADTGCYLLKEHAVLLRFLLNMEFWTCRELWLVLITPWSWSSIQRNHTFFAVASFEFGVRQSRINSLPFALKSHPLDPRLRSVCLIEVWEVSRGWARSLVTSSRSSIYSCPSSLQTLLMRFCLINLLLMWQVLSTGVHMKLARLNWRPRPHPKPLSAAARNSLVLDSRIHRRFLVTWDAAAGQNRLEAFCISRGLSTGLGLTLHGLLVQRVFAQALLIPLFLLNECIDWQLLNFHEGVDLAYLGLTVLLFFRTNAHDC